MRAFAVAPIGALFLVVELVGCSGDGSTEPKADTQAPTVNITSPAAGSFLTGSVAVRVDAQDNVGVTKVEVLIDGVVAATATTAPYEFTWNTDNLSDGTRTLSARAYDAAGNVGSSPVLSETIRHLFQLTFINRVFTDIQLNVQSQASPQVLPPAQALTYTYQGNPGTVAYTASTSGKTAQGTQVGLLVSWNYNISVAGKTADTVELIINPDLFFIYLKNTGTTALTPFYVNYGLLSQTLDNIRIPADGVLYRIGYYKAFTNTEVRAFREGIAGAYIYWDQGTHFTLPFTTNQSVTLLNNIAASVDQVRASAAENVTGTALADPLLPEAEPGHYLPVPAAMTARQHVGRPME